MVLALKPNQLEIIYLSVTTPPVLSICDPPIATASCLFLFSSLLISTAGFARPTGHCQSPLRPPPNHSLNSSSSHVPLSTRNGVKVKMRMWSQLMKQQLKNELGKQCWIWTLTLFSETEVYAANRPEASYHERWCSWKLRALLCDWLLRQCPH